MSYPFEVLFQPWVIGKREPNLKDEWEKWKQEHPNDGLLHYSRMTAEEWAELKARARELPPVLKGAR